MDNQINNENINNETEEKEKLVIPIQVYVVVCIGILLISIIVGMVIAKDNKQKPEESNNNTKVEEKVPETDKNKFSDKDAKKIYETKLPFVGHYVMQENLYTTSKVTYENANKSYLRAFAFQNIKFSEGQISSYVNEDGTLIVNNIKRLGIQKLDYVIGTHPHEDHIGGLDDVILNFDIGTIYMPKIQTNTKTFEDVLDAIESKNLKIKSPKQGEIFNIGDAKCEIMLAGTGSKEEQV